MYARTLAVHNILVEIPRIQNYCHSSYVGLLVLGNYKDENGHLDYILSGSWTTFQRFLISFNQIVI